MVIPHFAHAPGLRTPARSRTIRGWLSTPTMLVLGTLLVLVVVGTATGQVVGHLLAAGIEKLLDLIALGQSG